MRLARLAAAGLAIGVIAGFAIALLRPRPYARATQGSPKNEPENEPADPRGVTPDTSSWARFDATEKPTARPSAQKPSLVDMRAPRRVTG